MSAEPSIRVDKWLWYARFFKTRSLAAKLVSGGKLRIDGAPISKPARMVAPGMVLSFPQSERLRIVRILALGTRRGPAPEAQALYDDMTPEVPKDLAAPRAGPRPTKRDRRRMSQVVDCPDRLP